MKTARCTWPWVSGSDAMTGGSNYGDSVVRLHPDEQNLSVTDYFLSTIRSCSTMTLIWAREAPCYCRRKPGRHILTYWSPRAKDSTVYLLDRDNLGKWTPMKTARYYKASLGMPTDFRDPCGVEQYLVYLGSPMPAWKRSPMIRYNNRSIPRRRPLPARSCWDIRALRQSSTANGSADAILWILQTDQFHSGGPAILRAFDPANLATEFYDSNMSPDRDGAGAAVRPAPVPTVVADGQVFVAGHNEIDIYGLL